MRLVISNRSLLAKVGFAFGFAFAFAQSAMAQDAFPPPAVGNFPPPVISKSEFGVPVPAPSPDAPPPAAPAPEQEPVPEPVVELPPPPDAEQVAPPSRPQPAERRNEPPSAPPAQEPQLPPQVAPLAPPIESRPDLQRSYGGDGFIYNPEGLRDPFFPATGQGTEVARPRDQVYDVNDPLQAYELREYRLVAVLWDVNEPRALVATPDGKIWTIRQKYRLGRGGAVVAAIRESEVIIVEPNVDGTFKGAPTRILTMKK